MKIGRKKENIPSDVWTGSIAASSNMPPLADGGAGLQSQTKCASETRPRLAAI